MVQSKTRCRHRYCRRRLVPWGCDLPNNAPPSDSVMWLPLGRPHYSIPDISLLDPCMFDGQNSTSPETLDNILDCGRLWGFQKSSLLLGCHCSVSVRIPRSRVPIHLLTHSSQIYRNFYALFIPYFYIQLYATYRGVSSETAQYLLAIINAFGIPARVIPGLLADRFGM